MQLKPAIASGIRNLIFDFGGVLLDIDIRRTVEAFRRLGLAGLNPAEIHPQNTGIFLDLELGTVSEEAFVARLQSCAAGGLPVPTREQLLNAWNALLLDYDWRRFGLLDRLRESGYKVFLLSNTNRPHREYFIRKFDRENPAGRPFESYFDRCFYSDVMHLRKPDPAIYRTVLREAGIAAGETLFIDDNQPNTDAAAELGIQTVHLVPPATIFDLFA
ncbi:HAD family phosphatase [uncultured Rikenella sp.]|uniref:HAD family hydrolase n=1 Tax=uncultured Rikenella sp. TaxID=368003 RepID=UPI00262486F4|nr:HAD family phosphatase [uncultured Rikenella sp.]